MAAYIFRRLILIIPTLFGIMLINFAIIQFAPGGPVEQVIAELTHATGGATERFSGGGGDVAGGEWDLAVRWSPWWCCLPQWYCSKSIG